MRRVSFVPVAFLGFVLCCAPVFSQQPNGAPKDKAQQDSMKDCPMHRADVAESKAAGLGHSHESRQGAPLEQRGNAAMGFEQSKTTHHFLLRPDGGVIQVQATNAQDTTSIGQIRAHLQHIAPAFADGDFQIPMLVHDAIPPGTSTMRRLREKIQYAYEETPAGAQVVIKTNDASAVDAIHDFLRYQIREHETGDPETVH